MSEPNSGGLLASLRRAVASKTEEPTTPHPQLRSGSVSRPEPNEDRFADLVWQKAVGGRRPK